MPTTIQLYNHTARRFAAGENGSGDTYRVKLLTAATFNATHTTLAATGGTEVSNGGYTAGGQALTGLAVTTVSTNGARFTADSVVWTATGADLAASFAILYNDTDADDPPVAFINFDGEQSAGVGTDFRINWDASGILTFTVT